MLSTPDIKLIEDQIPSSIDTSPFYISETFTSKEDPFHWQQPCCTELEAFRLHQNLPAESYIDHKKRIVNTYIGLPWASFIDKKIYLGTVVNTLKNTIDSYKKIAKDAKYTLKVHSVCQSIHWKRMLDHFYHIGITDLHASHYNEILSKIENPYNIKIHSWHLYAVNVEDPSRNSNITFDVQDPSNSLLAAFKGAHMVHYISDVRLLLLNALKKDKIKNDIVIELDDEWHFNKNVFGQQAGTLKIDDSHLSVTNNDIYLYNDLLCRSTFSLCPEGAGINTIRLWETLAIGGVPVIILSKPHIPMLYRLHPDLYKCCILIFRDGVVNIFTHLRNISKDVINEKRQLSRKVYLDIKNQTTFKNQHNTLLEIY